MRWQIKSRLSAGVHRVAWLPGIDLLVRRGDHGLTGNLYCGLHEFTEMAFVLHYLRPDDLFVDIGANLGAYTLLASGLRRAQTIAVEPVPTTFARLQDNIALNRLEDRVTGVNIALGAREGTTLFSNFDDSAINRVLAEDEPGGIQVPMTTLDLLLHGSAPSLIKLDVEGHEAEVLAGASRTLKDHRPVLLMETLGGSEATHLLTDLGYEACSYDPFRRRLQPATDQQPNTLFVPDRPSCEARLATGEAIRVLGETI